MAKRKKKPRVPRSIQIGGHTIAVELDDTLGDRGEAHGLYFPSRDLIVIDPRYGDSFTSETFLHEILEAINNKCELNLSHSTIQVLGLLLHQALSSCR